VEPLHEGNNLGIVKDAASSHRGGSAVGGSRDLMTVRCCRFDQMRERREGIDESRAGGHVTKKLGVVLCRKGLGDWATSFSMFQYKVSV